MLHPVIAKDGHTYERDAIQQWFDNGNVRSPQGSPLHSTILLSTELIVNQAMKTFIQEWIEENTSLQGLQKQLQDFHGPLVTATTSKEVHETIKNIHELVRLLEDLEKRRKFFYLIKADYSRLFTIFFIFFCPLLNHF